MVCGYGVGRLYRQLANDLAKARIDKSRLHRLVAPPRFTEAQLAYAESDVTHLRQIYLALKVISRCERPQASSPRKWRCCPRRRPRGQAGERLAAAEGPSANRANCRC